MHEFNDNGYCVECGISHHEANADRSDTFSPDYGDLYYEGDS